MVAQITQLPPAPQRSDAPADFVSKADAHVASLTQFVNETNTVADEINVSAAQIALDAASVSADAAVAAAAANPQGEWSTLTGSLNTPASVTHNGSFWQLLNDLPDVTLSEPGVTADWSVIINIANIRSSKLDNPLLHLFKKNKLAAVSAPLDTAADVTWTRASTATYVDRYGVVKTAAIDTPREEAEGWLIEGESTNLALRSEEFDNASWVPSGVAVTADVLTSPDGNVSADLLTEDSSTGNHRVFQSVTGLVVSSTYSASVYVKANGRDNYQVELSSGARATFNSATGQVAETSGGRNAKIAPLGGGWFRLSFTFDATLTAEVLQIRLNESFNVSSYTGDGASGAYVWGAQVEELPFASSYIPTVASPVTRSADTAIVDSYYNTQSLGKNFTAFCSFKLLGLDYATTRAVFHISNGTSLANGHSLAINSDNVIASRVRSNELQGGFVADNTVYSAAISLSDGNSHLYLGSSTYTEVNTGVDTGQPLRLSLGTQDLGTGVRQLFGHIQDFRIYDFALNGDEIKFLGG